jgi:hypothetical protein
MVPDPPARSARQLLFVALLLGVSGQALPAQQLGSISGTIRTGASPNVSSLEGARVSLVGTPHVANSNRNGEFSFHGLKPGPYTVQASAIGYQTMTASVEVKALEMVQVVFEPEPVAVVLPSLEVTQPVRGTPDFLRRRATGRGRYFTRADIEKRDPKVLSDLIRMIPGLRTDCRGIVCRVYSARGGRNCVPAYFMDGIPVDPSAVWTTPPQDLEGMEVYSGPSETPPELEHRASCGAIVLWTRLPPERQPKPKKPQAVKPDTVKTPRP